MAYNNCKWCYGAGCNQCSVERKKAMNKKMEPIFTADKDNPDDMKMLNEVFGKKALEEAFGPDGGGIKEIETNACSASLKQIMRDKEY